jgi:hypothetical protein
MSRKLVIEVGPSGLGKSGSLKKLVLADTDSYRGSPERPADDAFDWKNYIEKELKSYANEEISVKPSVTLIDESTHIINRKP